VEAAANFRNSAQNEPMPILRIPLIVITWSGIVITDSDDRDHPVGAKRR